MNIKLANFLLQYASLFILSIKALELMNELNEENELECIRNRDFIIN